MRQASHLFSRIRNPQNKPRNSFSSRPHSEPSHEIPQPNQPLAHGVLGLDAGYRALGGRNARQAGRSGANHSPRPLSGCAEERCRSYRCHTAATMIVSRPWHAHVARLPISPNARIARAYAPNLVVVQVFTNLCQPGRYRRSLWNSYNVFSTPVSNSYAQGDR